MATQYAPIAKDSSINTTETTPRNIADVLAEELSAIEQAIAGGSGSGGHVIVNANGTDMAQRAKMQFVDADVTDDAVNDVTKISTTPASYPSANVTYGSGSVEDALDGLAYESEALQSGVAIKRLGKLRVLYIAGTFTVNSGAISINAIPSTDRPSQNILGEVGTAIVGTKYYPFSINLRTDGSVTGFALDVTQADGYRYLTGSPQIYATFTYSVN